MRSLIRGEQRRDDRGAILIWVALSIVVLLGVGALTIDLGALYVEKRQLQNGADAAALAIAYNCATGATCGPVATVADKLADDNANDGASTVSQICGAGPGLSTAGCTPPAALASSANWVQVSTTTENSDGSSQVRMLLAPVIGSITGKTVKATAIAQWGGLSSAMVAPLVFSACEYLALGGKLDGSAFPSGTTTVYFHSLGGSNEPGIGSCTPSTSGFDLPGGFGWVDSSNCQATLDAGGTYSSVDPGNSVPNACDPVSWVGKEVTLGLYDTTSGSGNNGSYHIVGFVSVKVSGVKFGGNNTSPKDFDCPLAPGGSGRCISGTFTKITSNTGTPGGPNLGVTTIKLIG